MSAARWRTLARRLVSVPALLVLVPVAAALFALCLLLTGPVSLLLRGAWRPVRLSGYLLLYVLAELFGLALSAADLFGPAAALQARSYARLGSLLDLLCRAAVPVFGLRVELDEQRQPQQVPVDRPLLVLARHAGPGDSFLLVHAAITYARLRPRIVLKQALRWDPCLDVLLGRVPHCFVPRTAAPHRTAEAIGGLVADLGPGDALVIFPRAATSPSAAGSGRSAGCAATAVGARRPGPSGSPMCCHPGPRGRWRPWRRRPGRTRCSWPTPGWTTWCRRARCGAASRCVGRCAPLGGWSRPRRSRPVRSSRPNGCARSGPGSTAGSRTTADPDHS
ncbi:hypothetical protein GXW83_16615 [Streptacidiphilus sp. PB12-B1b]|uniref:1-acyl-sn-glycerol-3-phosphate acyltransferase n=1 Tax=Streptacidiphilus sp. PB12-B1b TaxID=2705012 RepID=UPI0015F8B0C5|nr:1-acyl-sn-glycerol-3-phosphate acyltransferase [Streptacidiphilus sp. PB12-B1b]QMU77091.1 hypothetical protein GXW83_16615 [Streptacidiphilus sp. PB12-B1b]